MNEITITELSRNLSDFINRATYRGESFSIIRGGKAVAQITPAPTGVKVKDLRAVFASLPSLHPEDIENFDKDLAAIRKSHNEPVESAWDS